MSPWKRKYNNAAGVFVIALIFGVKVAVLDRAHPHAFTSWILGLFFLVAAGALTTAIVWHRKATRYSV